MASVQKQLSKKTTPFVFVHPQISLNELSGVNGKTNKK